MFIESASKALSGEGRGGEETEKAGRRAEEISASASPLTALRSLVFEKRRWSDGTFAKAFLNLMRDGDSDLDGAKLRDWRDELEIPEQRREKVAWVKREAIS